MNGIRDWFSSQLVSKSMMSSRPPSGSDSFFNGEPLEEGFDDQGETHSSSMTSTPIDQALCLVDGNLDNQTQSLTQQKSVEDSNISYHDLSRKGSDPLIKIEDLQVKFLRLLQRLSLPENNIMVAKVLYRIHLATLIRAEESDLKRINLRNGKTRAIVAQQEETGQPELDFSIRILVLGKTGVGKSATINSIFDQNKTVTDPFRPATDHVQEIVGTVDRIRISIIDTPGLLPPSASNVKRNRKILLSVKKYIRKSPPDIVLYFDRLDLFSTGSNDFPLMKLITEVFGASIWFNTILVMTHSSSAPPEGREGNPVNYDSYVNHCTDLLQEHIHNAVSDARLENPVLLVENHPHCRRNQMGEKVLPNGQVWISRFLLLCICTKVLSDVNTLLKLQASIELGPANGTRLPSLPHLLSSLLKHRQVAKPNGDENRIDQSLVSEEDEEDEYDQLPPIRVLTKSQFQKMTKSQKKEYLDELDYRETLYLKKQFKEEYRRQKETELSPEGDGVENPEASPEDVSLPDTAIPASFDSENPVHRYRGLLTSDRWLVRPTLDHQGWDHDVGFDGISVEAANSIGKDLHVSVVGQVSKDKRGFIGQSECATSYSGPGATYSVGLDIQSAGKDLMYTLHGDTELKNLWHNTADCGVSLTSFGKKYYFGAKIEDSVSVGKRLKFMANAGRMEGQGQVAHGGTLEATLRGRDFPVRNDMISLAMTVLSFNKENVFGGNIQTEFRLKRNVRLTVNASLNTQKMGQISVKTSSSEHLHIALIGIFTLMKAILRRIRRESLEDGESR